jgi:hypothetical protein
MEFGVKFIDEVTGSRSFEIKIQTVNMTVTFKKTFEQLLEIHEMIKSHNVWISDEFPLGEQVKYDPEYKPHLFQLNRLQEVMFFLIPETDTTSSGEKDSLILKFISIILLR